MDNIDCQTFDRGNCMESIDEAEYNNLQLRKRRRILDNNTKKYQERLKEIPRILAQDNINSKIEEQKQSIEITPMITKKIIPIIVKEV